MNGEVEQCLTWRWSWRLWRRSLWLSPLSTWRLPHDVDRQPPPTSLFVNEEQSRTQPWETARRVLQAAAVEANGRPGAYVTQEGVMQRANMVDAEHFRTIARYLDEQGWIADADADYGIFVMSASGITELIG